MRYIIKPGFIFRPGSTDILTGNGGFNFMDSFILFEQLLVLLALMLTGFTAYKTKLIDDHTYGHLSSLMVWILNPFLMISGVIGKNSSIPGKMIIENIITVCLFYGILFIIGLIYAAVMRNKGNESYLNRFMILFPNVGFMGVPLVKAVFGSEYIVLVAFYMLAFNLLCYSYGIYLAARGGGNREKFNPRKLISPGSVTAILSIVIFAFHINVPAPVASYVEYLGNTSISLSMIIIGVFLARMDWKTAFAKKKYFIFVIADMIIIPVIFVFLSRFLPFDDTVISIGRIMLCMPVASMTCMFSQEYGGDGSECAKIIALTTVCTVFTAPLVIWIAG